MEKKEQSESRGRYVWDRDKMAWVEAVQQPTSDDIDVKSVYHEFVEEPLEEIESEDVYAAEAVASAEEFEYRGAWIRLLSTAIDGIVILIINVIARLILGGDSAVASWLVPIIGAAYFIGLWTLRGQTLGKMIIGAKIIRTDGNPIGFTRAFLRYLVFFAYLLIARFIGGQYYVVFAIIIIVFITIAFSRDKRGLHDRIVGTLVINSRTRILEDYVEVEEGDEVYEAVDDVDEIDEYNHK